MTAMDAPQKTTRSSPSTSPRISFSLSSPADYPPYCSESNSDFHFCNSEAAETVTSSADEIFSNGFILPLHDVHRKPNFPSSSSPAREDRSLKETEQVKSLSKPFWRIGRSSSLHCERGSIWSFHSLPRSSSTGSNSKQTKVGNRHKLKSAWSSSPSAVNFYEFPLSSSQKPPLRPNQGNGVVRINPVLNVPPPSCISMGTTNLFGLGSLFRSGKDKKISKK